MLAALGRTFFDLFENVGELLAKEDGNNRRRRFVRTKAVIVVRAGDRKTKNLTVFGYSPNHGRAEHQKLRVVMRRIAGVQEIFPRIRGHRPVIVLSTAVNSGKRLLMQQAGQAILVSRPLHDFHDHVLVIRRQIAVFKQGSQFKLARRHLVMPRFYRHAELDQFIFTVCHEREHAFGNDPEILIFQLLPLGRSRAKQSAAASDQIGTSQIKMLVDEEIFLLSPHGGEDLMNTRMSEKVQNTNRLRAQGAMLFSNGVFLSRASPVQLRNAVGMTSVEPFGCSMIYAGLVGSQAV